MVMALQAISEQDRMLLNGLWQESNSKIKTTFLKGAVVDERVGIGRGDGWLVNRH